MRPTKSESLFFANTTTKPQKLSNYCWVGGFCVAKMRKRRQSFPLGEPDPALSRSVQRRLLEFLQLVVIATASALGPGHLERFAGHVFPGFLLVIGENRLDLLLSLLANGGHFLAVAL